MSSPDGCSPDGLLSAISGCSRKRTAESMGPVRLRRGLRRVPRPGHLPLVDPALEGTGLRGSVRRQGHCVLSVRKVAGESHRVSQQLPALLDAELARALGVSRASATGTWPSAARQVPDGTIGGCQTMSPRPKTTAWAPRSNDPRSLQSQVRRQLTPSTARRRRSRQRPLRAKAR